MEKQINQPQCIIKSNDLILCPNCNTHFPEIKHLKIKDQSIEVFITCDNCSEFHRGKYVNIETLLNCNFNENEPLAQCHICDNTNKNVNKYFCITCEKWICHFCIQCHDDFVMNDQNVLDDKEKLIHCFCDREIYLRQKCCIHHNIKPIDKKVIDNRNKGSFKSIDVDGVDNDDSMAIVSNAINNENGYSNTQCSNQYTNVVISDIPGSESISYNNETDAFSKTGASPSPESYCNINNNDNNNNSTIDNSNAIYDDNNNIIANYEGNVYAVKYCEECNLYFCESCAIDHENIMNHSFTNENDDPYVTNGNDKLAEFIIYKNNFVSLIKNANKKINEKQLSNISNRDSHNSSKNSESFLSTTEKDSLNEALALNIKFHDSYIQLLLKAVNSYNTMNVYESYNPNIINSFKHLSQMNSFSSLSSDILISKKYFHTFHTFLLTKFLFKTERISCFKENTIRHHGVTSMLYFGDRFYTGGIHHLKKWRFPYTAPSSSTLLKTREGDLTGRINCFCRASDSLILAGTQGGNILLCDFGKDSGIRITSTDRRQPILCMQLILDENRTSTRRTCFLLSDMSGIWEISIEHRNGKTVLSEVEFFKTKDDIGENVPVRAILPAKGARSCFLLGGLDYVYPKFRGNTLIKIQDSIKCSERDANKLISCMVYVEATEILVVGGYDCCVGALVLGNPQQKSRYKEIAKFDNGVVSIISKKENEVIALSADGEFKIVNISYCYENAGFKWEEVAMYRSLMAPSVSLSTLQTGYIAICGCDKIEIWYVNM